MDIEEIKEYWRDCGRCVDPGYRGYWAPVSPMWSAHCPMWGDHCIVCNDHRAEHIDVEVVSEEQFVSICKSCLEPIETGQELDQLISLIQLKQ